MRLFIMLFQLMSALLFAMVAGSVFGIWRGYDPTVFTAPTFVEVQQGAVRGLNTLLPVLGIVSTILTLVLTWLARGKGTTFWLYLSALLLMVVAGVVTRFFNQPINAQVMNWTVASLPANWADLRSTWWNWHLLRTGFSVVGLALLLAAIILDRPALL